MDIENAFKLFKEEHNNKIIELNKEHFVSEWSWQPIVDGIFTYKETIRFVEEVDGYKIYTTGDNYRYYFAWDIHLSKLEAEDVCNIKNQFGYDWDMMQNRLVDRSKIKNLLK